MRKPNVALFGLTAGLLSMALLAPAAMGAPSKADALEKRAVEQLAKSWGAFYQGKHQEAATLAQPLLKLTSRQNQWLLLEAAHVQARASWAHGSGPGRVKARQIWLRLKRTSTRNSLLARLKIAAALEAEATGEAGKLGEAIGILEPIVQAWATDTSTPEAALDLARLYVKARRFDEAEKTLKALQPWIAKRLLLETPKALGAPFQAEATAALARLKYQRDAGRAEFEAAEKLRAAKKWSAAAGAYQAVVKKFPDSDYAARSELHIGHCHVGLGRAAMAVRQWEKFIQASPSGPWRGQAQVELIDLYLEQMLDLAKAGRYAEMARSSLPGALADKRSSDSWRAVAFDVHLRIGTVAFARGDGAAAAAALKDARKAGAARKDKAGHVRPGKLPKAVEEGLGRLIAAAEAGRPLLPETVRGDPAKPSQATAALAMAMIYHLAGRRDNAMAMLARVLPAKLRPKAHASARPIAGVGGEPLAFAVYCLARLGGGGKNLPPPKALAELALQSAPKAPWHDATLYLLAAEAERDARAQFGQKTTIVDPKTKKPKPLAQLTLAERKQMDQAEAKRLAEHIKARLAALPYYRELVHRFPKSPYVAPSAYHAGVLLQETGQFKDAAALFQQFVHAYPDSPFAGDACARLIDIALERMFDLALAQAMGEQAAQWAGRAKSGPPAAAAPDRRPAAPLWGPGITVPPKADLDRAGYECLLRAGLVAYLAGQYDRATSFLDKAGPRQPPKTPTKKPDLAGIGLHYLLQAIRRKKPITSPRALDEARTERGKLAIQLGDLYLEAIRPDKAEDVFLRVIEGKGEVGKATRGYAILQLAVALDRQKGKRPLALTWLAELAGERYKGMYWGAYGLFRLALFTYNQTQDLERSLTMYQEVIRRYPDHPITELASVYYCLNASRAGQQAAARRAGMAFLKKYPTSPWNPSIRKIVEQRDPDSKGESR